MVKYLKQYQILFNKAKTDLTAAKILLDQFKNSDTELDLEIIFFHLQQSIEKLLKATISKNEIYYPKTHDLEQLFNLIDENKIDLVTNRKLLMKLNYYAVEGRYAVIHDDLDKADKYIHELTILTEKVNLLLQD